MRSVVWLSRRCCVMSVRRRRLDCSAVVLDLLIYSPQRGVGGWLISADVSTAADQSFTTGRDRGWLIAGFDQMAV